MTTDDMDASKAPLIEHLVELRSRLIKSLLAFLVMFFACFFFARHIYNILVFPYVMAAGGDASQVKLIYTAPLEYLFTQIKIAIFGSSFFSFPVVATQIYKFVAPGLYKNEKDAFLPYLIATPVLFLLGAAVVFFIAMPIVMTYSIGQQQIDVAGEASIALLPKVSEYLSLIMTLIFAFGITFQLPVVLTLLAALHSIPRRRTGARPVPAIASRTGVWPESNCRKRCCGCASRHRRSVHPSLWF